MAFQGFHHIGLMVQDIDRSLAFYTAGLGGQVTFSFPMGDSGKTIYLVDLGGHAVVELIPKGTGEPETGAHWAHIAVETNDAQGAYQRALDAGALSRSAPKEGTLGTMRAINPFVTGPDGEVIEFFQVL